MAFGPFSTSDYFQLDSVIVNAYPITMACWFYPTAGAGQRALMTQCDNSTYAGLDILGTTLRMAPTIAGRFSGGTVNLNVWNSAVGIITNATDGAIFTNGSKVTSATPGAFTVSLRQNIGARNIGSVQIPFEGYIAKVAIWSAALTDDEALAFNLGASPLQIRPQSLALYRPQISDNVDLKGSVWTLNGTIGTFPQTRQYLI